MTRDAISQIQSHPGNQDGVPETRSPPRAVEPAGRADARPAVEAAEYSKGCAKVGEHLRTSLC